MLFQQEVSAARQGDTKENSVWLAGRKVTLPPAFVSYIDSRAQSLLTISHLELYVSAVESGRTTDPSLLVVQGIVTRFRRQIDQIPTWITFERFSKASSTGARSGPVEPGLLDVSELGTLEQTVER